MPEGPGGGGGGEAVAGRKTANFLSDSSKKGNGVKTQAQGSGKHKHGVNELCLEEKRGKKVQLQLQLRLRLQLQLLNALEQFAHIYYIYISTSMSLHLCLHLHLPDRTLIADWPLIGRRQKPQRVLFSSCQGFWNTVEGLGAEILLCQHLAADIDIRAHKKHNGGDRGYWGKDLQGQGRAKVFKQGEDRGAGGDEVSKT
ncbi:predicted protein [Histoplasma capsulatum G186AR]|uniref:Uncharacterized protein n=1 Tax=Ajellomyces capsulatus (strain G186AR / H82 / ATCC MYA-2454 / RMSCC 2432) TaxID=447093 RepID=C0NAA5_AJECG|nr:uncharacterized protein HCBG_00051 [Histoplasma capsulatum G186AR]EEH10596.1 predicted protein [Histoplasma capsulatum G186AR]